MQNPQVLGKFKFMEFSTTSRPATAEKQSTLVLNGSNSFVDNVGNPHITGNIINQGQSPEQLLNLAITFYDNSSLGIIGAQSFELNVVNLANNQMTPFDITVTDNKTKSQDAFYLLNMDSTQSSMSPPFNPKFSFSNGGTMNNEQFINTGLTSPLLNRNRVLVTTNNQFGNAGDVLNCDDFNGQKNIPVGNNDPNNFDGDGDGIGCESSSNNDDDNLNTISGDNNSRCPDGSHRSPDGDCERVNGNSDDGNNEGNNDNQGDGGS